MTEQLSDTARYLLDLLGGPDSMALQLMAFVAVGWLVAYIEQRFEVGWQPRGLNDPVAAPMAALRAQTIENSEAEIDRADCYSETQRIVSPVRTYVLSNHVGLGDLCDVHSASGAGGDWILKISRSPDAGGLMLKEFRVVQELIDRSYGDVYRRYPPQPVETFFAGHRHVSVYQRRRRLFSAEEIRRQHPQGLDGVHLAWMFNRTLEAIGYAHNNGWIHGAVLPPHLMFDVGDHGLQLVGWTHAERLRHRLRSAPIRFRDWYPPECHEKRPATPSLDIYLAAKSMVYLAGGNPTLDRIPQHVPAPIRRFFGSCLLESVGMRPHDAWALHEQFAELLEAVYGPPTFRPLEMSRAAPGASTSGDDFETLPAVHET